MSTSLISVHSIPGTGPRRRRRSVLRRLLARPSVIVFGTLLLAIMLACFLAPWLAPSPNSAAYEAFLAPSSAHLMGTDNLGRDLLGRLLHGGQVSLAVGFAVAAICLVLGVFAGGLAGFHGGAADAILNRVMEFFQVLPVIVVALAATAILGGGTLLIIMVLGLTLWVQVARIMRAEAMRIGALGYIESSRAVGFGSFRIFLFDVVPNALPPVLVATTMTIGRAIIIESALSFLGLGDANTPSWGALLNASQQFIQISWWMTVFPGAAIFIVVLAANMLGDRFNDVLNPTLSRVKS